MFLKKKNECSIDGKPITSRVLRALPIHAVDMENKRTNVGALGMFWAYLLWAPVIVLDEIRDIRVHRGQNNQTGVVNKSCLRHRSMFAVHPPNRPGSTTAVLAWCSIIEATRIV